MKVTFIQHSSYAVELDHHVLIFDWIGGEYDFPQDKEIIFIVTHGHDDHYTPGIFDLPGDRYFLSDDISGIPETGKEVEWISPRNSYTFKDLNLVTTASTDEGCSVYVKVEGKGIYHGGDLTYWVWPRYDEDDVAAMEREFTREVDFIASSPMDVAFIIVDPRLGDDYRRGPEVFLRSLSAKHFFPTHMWEDYRMSQRFIDDFSSAYPEKTIHLVTSPGQSYEI